MAKRRARKPAPRWAKPSALEEGTPLTYLDPRARRVLFESTGEPFEDLGCWWRRVRNALTGTEHIIQAGRLYVVTDTLDALTRLQKT
jgi:hypothetical protein